VEGTGAAALCPCHSFLSPPFPLTRGLCQSLRSWMEAAVPLLPVPGAACRDALGVLSTGDVARHSTQDCSACVWPSAGFPSAVHGFTR